MTSRAGSRLVEVVLNRPLWQSFTYSIPARLHGGQMEGCRVVVPFGADRLIGYVWEGSSGKDGSGIEVKEVLDRLDSAPLLSEG